MTDQTPDAPPTRPSEDATQEHVRTLRFLLARTGRVVQRGVVREGVLWWGASVLALGTSALGAAALIPPVAQAGILAPLLVLTSVMIIGGAGVWIWYSRQHTTPVDVARLLQQHEASWRHDLVSALTFGQRLVEGAFDDQASAQLARAHVEDVAMRAREVAKQGSLAHQLPPHDTSGARVALLGGLIVLCLPLIFASDWVGRVLVGQGQTQIISTAPKVLKRPLVGNMVMLYDYPDYTGEEDRQEFMTTGNIRAVEGTKVTLETFSLLGPAQITSLSVVVQDAQGKEREEVLTPTTSRSITKVFDLSKSGRYTFRATTAAGVQIEDPAWRTIDVDQDAPPSVQITSHQGTIEVSPEDVLEITYVIKDDHGITGLTRAHQFEPSSDGQPTRKILQVPALQAAPREHQGTLRIDLSSWDLQPKDAVSLTLEASDNNTLTGPGVGISVPVMLVVSSPEDKHMRNIEAQTEVMESLVSSLADVLESSVGERVMLRDSSYVQRVDIQEDVAKIRLKIQALDVAHKALGERLGVMGELVERLKQDPMMIPRDLTMFETLHTQLVELHVKGTTALNASRTTAAQAQPVATYAASMETALEKGILRLEDLLASQQMQSVQATAASIKELKEKLKSLLHQYKNSKDPELKKAIKREIQRLRQRMAELMARMQAQAKQLPQEHMNADAINQARMESDTKKMVDNFQSIEKMLEQDDIDGALKALDEMTQNLDSLTDDMKKQFGESKPEELKAFDKEVSSLMDEVNDIASMQRDVEKKTQALQEKMQKEQQASMTKALKEAKSQVLKDIERQQKGLDAMKVRALDASNQRSIERLKSQLARLKKSVTQQDVAQGLKDARQWLEEADALRMSMRLGRQYVPQDRPRYGALKQGLRDLDPMRARGEDIRDALQNLMDQAQAQQSSMQQDKRSKALQDQQESVNERTQKFQERVQKSGEKFPALEKTLKEDLDGVQKSMKDANKGLKRKRMQRALDGQRQSIDGLGRMKQSMKKSLENQRKPKPSKKGPSQSSPKEEEIDIPGAGTQEGAGYREAVKKGMKEDRLRDYSSEIERYYKSLVE